MNSERKEMAAKVIDYQIQMATNPSNLIEQVRIEITKG
jgi:hypothetical protein